MLVSISYHCTMSDGGHNMFMCIPEFTFFFIIAKSRIHHLTEELIFVIMPDQRTASFLIDQNLKGQNSTGHYWNELV